jgi:nicotinamidase/pyrazinamidase
MMDSIISLPTGVEKPKKAARVLLIVDMQKDFMPVKAWSSGRGGRDPIPGALPVADGANIIPNIVKEAFSGYDLVIATRDFHPGNHFSFKELGGEWPMHCVAGSEGADIVREIDMVSDVIVSKGTNLNTDGYSGFDNTPLSQIISGLQKPGEPVPEVVVTGVAIDYCVFQTACDAKAMGYTTTVLLDCVAGVAEETTDDALLTMHAAGITLQNRD